MNETEKDRILKMVAEGTLRPNEAAHLLAALSEPTAPAPQKEAAAKPAPVEEKKVEVMMERPDGTKTVIQVSPSLGTALLQMAGVMIKESVKTAAQETWDGMKVIAKNKTEEIKTNVKDRVNEVTGGKKPAPPVPAIIPPKQDQQNEARRQIIQMVQNGRISAADAARLIDQIDSLHAPR